jgi:hypothetical protein
VLSALHNNFNNAVCPGATHAPMQTDWFKDRAIERTAAADPPLGRFGRPIVH